MIIPLMQIKRARMIFHDFFSEVFSTVSKHTRRLPLSLFLPRCSRMLQVNITCNTSQIQRVWKNWLFEIIIILQISWFQGLDSHFDEERALKHHLLQLQRSFAGQLARKHGPSWAFGKFLLLPDFISQFIFQADFVSGACLGAFISTVFYPVNTTKTHMQKTLGGEFQSFRSVFRHLLKERGAWGMFRGVHVNYTRSFMSWGIINMSYSLLLGLLASWSLLVTLWSSADLDSDEPWWPAEPWY